MYERLDLKMFILTILGITLAGAILIEMIVPIMLRYMEHEPTHTYHRRWHD